MHHTLDIGLSEWRTRQGRDRNENRDASGVHIGTNQTLAVIVDGAESGPQGIAYAKHWVHEILKIAQSHESLAPPALISAMREAHAGLRGAGYLLEKAAYAALLLDPRAGTAWAVSCGDCRLAGVTAEGQVQWLTPVHTCANPLGEDFTLEHAQTAVRHTLTRRLQVRRFEEPEVTHLESTEFTSWILATDGYWIEHLWLNGVLDDLEDDASALFLTLPLETVRLDTACSNFVFSQHCNMQT